MKSLDLFRHNRNSINKRSYRNPNTFSRFCFNFNGVFRFRLILDFRPTYNSIMSQKYPLRIVLQHIKLNFMENSTQFILS
jgi:hypothetical protein